MKKALKVLIVEDNESDADLIIFQLKRSGYHISHLRVDELDSFEQALKEGNWSVILSDFSLPGFNAFDCLKILKASTHDIPFILISGMVGEETAVSMMKAGAHDYIMKGNLHKLIVVIERELIDAQNRQELRKAEGRLDRALKGSSDGLWEWNILTGEFHFSKRWKEMLGYSNSELEGTINTFNSLVHPDDVDSNNSVQISHFKINSAYDVEIRLMTKSNGYRWFRNRGQVIKNDNNIPVLMAGTITDIQELKTMQIELKQKISELTNTNNSLKRFTYVISHDLQDPLATITNYLNIINSRFENSVDEKVKTYLHFALDGASRMKHLITDLLEYTQLNANDFEVQPVDIEQVLDRAERILDHEIKRKGVKIIRSKFPIVTANLYMLERLFEILILNALNRCNKVGMTIRIIIQSEAEVWKFDFNDDGFIMDSMSVEMAFELFDKADVSEEYCADLSLSIAKQIVIRHKGLISVRSDIENGTTFSFTVSKHFSYPNEFTFHSGIGNIYNT